MSAACARLKQTIANTSVFSVQTWGRSKLSANFYHKRQSYIDLPNYSGTAQSVPFLDTGTVLTLRRRSPEALSDTVICNLMRLNAVLELRNSFMKTMGFMTARLMIEIRAQLAPPPGS
jgi:hypothetical protein